MNPNELTQSLLLSASVESRHRGEVGSEPRSRYVRGAEIVQDVAVIPISGILGKHLSGYAYYSDSFFDLADLEATVIELTSRDDISTVTIPAHTPGGDAVAAHDAAELLASLATQKRLVGFVDNCACSAGYWILAACPEIYATPAGVSGNIGTRLAITDQSRAWDEAGLKKELFASGSLKAPGEPGLALTQEQREFLEARVASMAKPFREFVTARRAVDPEVFKGGWYHGLEAQQMGLIDGTFPTLAHLVASLIDSEGAQ